MVEPPIKKAMMELPVSVPNRSIQGESASKKKICSSDFFKHIRYSDHFVDKSLLLPSLFKTKDMPVVLVTAPRRFGKSVNLTMIHNFLEKQVHSRTGCVIPSSDKNSNYKLFEGLKVMEAEHQNFVREHFGQYAVLKASFLCVQPISSERRALAFCKKVIHKAYKEHEYLCDSDKLKNRKRIICEQWCDDKEYLQQPDDLVPDALKNLSEYLFIHYEEKLKVFVLIDEYDSLYLKAMRYVKKRKELEKIVETSISLVSNLVKENEYVGGVFLTGISHIAGFGLSSGLARITSHRFLKEDNPFVEYYGFTEFEIDYLLKKFKISDEKRKILEQKYNGYQIQNGSFRIYNTWSIVNYLETRIAKNYWVNSGAVEGLSFAFKIGAIKTEIEKTFMDSENESYVAVVDKFTNDDFFVLHSMLHKTNCASFTPELFFTFLFEQGYLTYGGSTGSVKIPNGEVKQELQRLLARHFQQVYRIKSCDVTDCSKSFQKLFSSVEADSKTLTELLSDLKKKLEKLVLPIKKKEKVKEINHNVMQQVLFGPLFATRYGYATEIYTTEKTKSDFFMYKDNCGIIIELKFMPDSDNRGSSLAGLKQILEKKYYSLLTDEMYFPKPATRYLLIGLSFNENLQVSMHCLQSTKDSMYRDLLQKNISLVEEQIDALIREATVISF